MGSDQNKAILYSSLLALQFGLQPLIATRCSSLLVSSTSLVIGTELGKILIAAVSIGSSSTIEKESIRHTWNLKDSLYYAALPAVLYAVQNVLVQIGYTLIDSMTFNLLNQTKVYCNELIIL
jgi:solute carrier family 35 (UDP-sugar transporter), member A1/2/3